MRLFRFMNWWPPLLGAGIKVRWADADFRAVDVEMRLSRWNKNFMGAHYGGSLYSMTDPFYAVMVYKNLGPGHVVWDKAASIRYWKPGRGTVRAEFRLTAERVAEIRAVIESEDRAEPRFAVEIKDGDGDVVSEVERVLYCAKAHVHEARVAARAARNAAV